MLDKVYISYFYQIRFFTPRFIPLSTALWDPKWYNEGKGRFHISRNKNGVIYGLRAEMLHPSIINNRCVTCKKSGDPNTCEFMRLYREQIYSLDFEKFMEGVENFVNKINEKVLKLDGEVFPVFIVYEAPDNKCSERVPLIEWFESNGVECIEWSKDLI